ncbi:pyruvate, water dikinase regulatory protein [Cohnella abietis]|uniref:Putative pyruvate, phosphate dikinase regulatory protein n=1 Tax=Cohnella abietis TaxID=2507935 RepID=A0A3T1D444_9BACL|nr:pyruvate, water dikinase regulatory protein [Cohnella abietis]BBI32864.1 phosphoenolpyruvate synthase regulatory protein [Cohnella abietis]
MNEKERSIFVCSDSVGETAEAVVRATIRQFNAHQTRITRYAHIKNEEEIRILMEEASSQGAFIAYTLVLPELREMMVAESNRLKISAVDIMGPVMQAFIDTFHDSPKREAGLLHRLDEEYYRRVEAIEFTVKCDDGKDMNAIHRADIVLLGVSRTSKTPLSIYLAHKGYKVCNYPLVPDVKSPRELLQQNKDKLVGLTMKAEQLSKIRTERLKSVGLPKGAKYASMERVVEELEFAMDLYKQLGCMVIDVTEKAIEETAGIITESYSL